MTDEPPETGPGPDAMGPDPTGSDPEDGVFVHPLMTDDPPKIGDFWVDGRLGAVPAGVAFTCHDDDNTPVMVLLLSEGAASDAAARDRFAGLINVLHIDTVVARGGKGQDTGRLAKKFRARQDPVAPDSRDDAPWAALAYDGSPAAAAEAERILNEVQLSWLPQQGHVSGPDYRLHWISQIRPGLARLWPLPWPGRFDRAGWKPILISWLLMLLLAALAVLIAILIFRNQPPQAPPPPTGGSGTPPPQSSSAGGSPPPQSGSGSPPPQSASASPQSASPSSASGSPSSSGSQSGSASSSSSASGSASASPTEGESSAGGGGGGDPSMTSSANATDTPRSKL